MTGILIRMKSLIALWFQSDLLAFNPILFWEQALDLVFSAFLLSFKILYTGLLDYYFFLQGKFFF
jgi:hypothetical protein